MRDVYKLFYVYIDGSPILKTCVSTSSIWHGTSKTSPSNAMLRACSKLNSLVRLTQSSCRSQVNHIRERAGSRPESSPYSYFNNIRSGCTPWNCSNDFEKWRSKVSQLFVIGQVRVAGVEMPRVQERCKT